VAGEETAFKVQRTHSCRAEHTLCAEGEGVAAGLVSSARLPCGRAALRAFPLIALLLVFVLVIHKKGHVLFTESCRGADSSRHAVVEEDGAGGMQTHLGRGGLRGGRALRRGYGWGRRRFFRGDRRRWNGSRKSCGGIGRLF